MAKQQTRRLKQWEAQSQKIVREKASRQRMKVWWLKLRVVLAAAAVIVAMTVAGLWFTGILPSAIDRSAKQIYTMSARLGFSLNTIYLEGRGRVPLAEVQAALGVKRGDPILGLSPGEIRRRLEALADVKHAAVERALPGTLYVRIVEREPVAIWRTQGNLMLVDEGGTVMRGLKLEDYRDLMVISGEEAPKHLTELLELLATQPQLQVSAAVRYGNRRWDIELPRGVEVKLPEQSPKLALKKLAELQQAQQILDRDITVVDLRDETRMSVRLTPAALPKANKRAAATGQEQAI